jgi:hypothetical protein
VVYGRKYYQQTVADVIRFQDILSRNVFWDLNTYDIEDVKVLYSYVSVIVLEGIQIQSIPRQGEFVMGSIHCRKIEFSPDPSLDRFFGDRVHLSFYF